MPRREGPGPSPREPALIRAGGPQPQQFPVGQHPLHPQHVAGAVAHVDAVVSHAVHGGGAGQGGAHRPRPDKVGVEPPLHGLRLQLRPADVGLHHGDHVLLVYLQDAIHAAQVDLDHAFACGARVHSPSCTESLELQAVAVADPYYFLDFLSRGGKDDRFRASRPQLRVLVEKRLPGIGVEHRRLAGDVLLAHHPYECCIRFFRYHTPQLLSRASLLNISAIASDRLHAYIRVK